MTDDATNAPAENEADAMAKVDVEPEADATAAETTEAAEAPAAATEEAPASEAAETEDAPAAEADDTPAAESAEANWMSDERASFSVMGPPAARRSASVRPST